MLIEHNSHIFSSSLKKDKLIQMASRLPWNVKITKQNEMFDFDRICNVF